MIANYYFTFALNATWEPISDRLNKLKEIKLVYLKHTNSNHVPHINF